MGTNRRLTALWIVPIALLALAGCGTGQSTNPWDIAPTGAADSAAATATPEPVSLVEDVDGSGVVDDWELGADSNSDGKLSEFEKYVAEKKRPVDYVMPDGSSVNYVPGTPVPDEIKQVIASEAAPLVGESDSENSGDIGERIRLEVAKAHADRLNQPVLIVYPTDSAIGWVWASVASEKTSTGVLAKPSKDEMVAAMTKWADNSGYTLVVVE